MLPVQSQSQSSHQQQQPPPADPKPVALHDVDDVDRLSSLHDDVLGSIITLLPTKDGARTQVLSRRFLPLWRSSAAPLNLEATLDAAPSVDPPHQPTPTTPPRPSSAFVGALQAHPGPARRVSLTWLGSFHDFPKLDALLMPLPHRGGGGDRFPCLDGGVREFELYYKPTNVPDGRRHPPPMATLLRFSRTLRVLTLCSAASCYTSYPYRLAFPPETDAACRALEFPSLEQLTLKNVSISDAALHALLSRCPALRSLVLHKNEGYGRVVIRSPTLRSLAVSDGAEVVVEDAPMLEKLIPRQLWLPIRIQVVHAPRLKTLGYLSDRISEFEMGTILLKGMVVAAGASSMIRTVKILALDSPRDLDAVIDLLKCFPCVEKLYMELQHYGHSINVVPKDKNARRNKKNARRNNVPIECLDAHLKVLELRNYNGRKRSGSSSRILEC